jgi:hypothetical protein
MTYNNAPQILRISWADSHYNNIKLPSIDLKWSTYAAHGNIKLFLEVDFHQTQIFPWHLTEAIHPVEIERTVCDTLDKFAW